MRFTLRPFIFIVMRFYISVILCLLVSAKGFSANPAESMGTFCADLPRSEYSDLQRIPFSSDWFELYQVAEGVVAIYEPYQWQEVISYLIEGQDEALLFDTGNGIADIAAVAAALTDKPISVLNSHSHYDHVGGNYSFDKIYGMDTNFTRRRQTGHANENIAIEASPSALCRGLPAGVTEKNHIGRAFKITDFIQDGFIIDLGDRKLEVLHIPGHTPDSIALIDRAAKLMWTGDSYYSGPIWLFAPETDLQAYAQSLERLSTETSNLKALLPAHNTPLVAPQVLTRLPSALQSMMLGKAKRIEQGDGMVEYQILGESEFSFLMRDEALPYKK